MTITDEMGKFYALDGRVVHTTRHVPCRRGFLGLWRHWFPVLRYADRIYVDDLRFEGGFRVYREVPSVESGGE